MHPSANGKQIARLVPLVVLLVLALAPGRAPHAQPLTFNTTTVLTSSPNPSLSHEAITFTATVTAQAGAPPVTGTVFFASPTIDGGFGSAALDANGQATFTLPFGLDIPFDYVIQAFYSGTSELNRSETSIVHRVNAPPTATPTATPITFATTTVLTSSPNPSLSHEAITFTATVTAQAGAPPVTGTVFFASPTIDGGFGSAALDANGQATFTLPFGLDIPFDYVIQAFYSGTSELNRSETSIVHRVNAPPTATPTATPITFATTTVLTSSPNPSRSHEAITFTASVTAQAGAPPVTGTVYFASPTIDGGLGSAALDANGQATFTLPFGLDIPFDYVIQAFYGGTSELNPSEASIVHRVNAPPTSTPTFTPTSTGTGVFLEDGVPGTPIEDGDTVDMGFVQAGVVGDYPLVLHNPTDSTVTITAVTGASFPGINTDIADSLPVQVAAHSFRPIRLFCFDFGVTTFNVSLSVSTNVRDFNFSVVCTVLGGAPDIKVSDVSTGLEVLTGDTVNLGNAGVGAPLEHTFRIENVGTGVLQSINFDPIPAGLTFTTDISPSGLSCIPGRLPGGRLGPGECFDLFLTCGGSTAGTVGGVVPINSSDPDENPFTFTATCNVLAGELTSTPTGTATPTPTETATPTNTATSVPPGPEITVLDWNGVSQQSGGTLDMGDPTEPGINDRILTLLNDGDQPLNFGNSSIVDPGGVISAISHFPVYDTTVLNPGETFPMRLLCSPLAPGTYTAILTIPSNDADEPIFTLTVLCTMPPTPTPTATSTPTSTPTATATSTPTDTPTVTNTPTPSFDLNCPGPSNVDNGNALRFVIEGPGGANSNGQDDIITLLAGCIYDVSGPGGTLEIGGDGGHSLTIHGNGATISGNAAVTVMRVEQSANLTLNVVVIRDGGTLTGFGGGIDTSGTLTLTNSSLVNNRGERFGGIRNFGTLTVTNSTFSGNTTVDSASGGGVDNSGTLTVSGSTFSGNSAGLLGGGIANSGTLIVSNSTFSNNAATDGGGIHNSGSLTVSSSTFSGNSAVRGGDIDNGSTAHVGNSVFANHVGGDCSGLPVIQDAPNLGCGGSVTGDPMLGALTGSPAYFQLLPGSAAIDAGDNSLCPATDQRGASRPQDGDGDGTATCDLGSFEADVVFATSTPTPTFTPTVTPTPTETFTPTAHDLDGVDDVVENAAPNNGDGNADGISDSQQDNVASLPNLVDGGYVTFVSPPSTQLRGVQAIPNPSPGNTPTGVSFPVGFFAFDVTGIPVGGSVDVQLLLPAGVTANSYYKHGLLPGQASEAWYEFTYDSLTGAEFAATTVTLHFTDGQRGDGDIAANAAVADPGAPAFRQLPTATWTPSPTATSTPTPTRTPTPTPGNRAPQLTVYLAQALMLPGGFAANLGDYLDPDGDNVTLQASVGSITKTGASSGLWLWSYTVPRGTPRGTTIAVTLTATDARGALTTSSFVVRVR